MALENEAAASADLPVAFAFALTNSCKRGYKVSIEQSISDTCLSFVAAEANVPESARAEKTRARGFFMSANA